MNLELNGLMVDCIIGDRPEERRTPQRLRVDVVLEIGEAAATSDRLADTVDYAALAARLRAALTAARAEMLERAAKVALDAVLAEDKVLKAKVKVTKFGAVPYLESASVSCEGGRQDG